MKDWTEDFEHENGMYQNRCRTCNELFIGHKRRMTCKECASKQVSVEPVVKPACDEQILQAKIDENEYWLKFLNADASNIIHTTSLINRVKFLENENRKSV